MNDILVTRSSMPELEEYMEEIRSIWDSHWLTNNGVKQQELEQKLTEFLEVPYVRMFCNGHSALEMILQAYDFPKGSEIITSPFTFASTTQAIVRNGCIPVFCDIRESDYTMDPEKIEALITEKTVAIVPIHVYGHVCDVEKIDEIAGKHGLKVVYDAAHAFAVRYKGKGVASFGDAAMFSFHATKVFNTIEGGAVCLKDREIAEKLNHLKDFGLDGEDVSCLGGNGKMTEFSAAMGLCNLRHLDREIAKRKEVVECYRRLLGGIPGLVISFAQDDVKENYAYFPVRIQTEAFGADREEVLQALKEQHIFARKYFYPITSAFSCYRDLFAIQPTPIAETCSCEVLTLPMYADLAPEDVQRICNTILGCRK